MTPRKSSENNLSIEELQRAVEEADAIADMKSNFLATMSHEIRTPMQTIFGLLELIGDEKPSDKIQEMVGTAQTAAAGLLEILDDILDLAKMDADKMELDSVPGRKDRVAELLQMVRSANELRAQIDSHNAEIEELERERDRQRRELEVRPSSTEDEDLEELRRVREELRREIESLPGQLRPATMKERRDALQEEMGRLRRETERLRRAEPSSEPQSTRPVDRD